MPVTLRSNQRLTAHLHDTGHCCPTACRFRRLPDAHQCPWKAPGDGHSSLRQTHVGQCPGCQCTLRLLVGTGQKGGCRKNARFFCHADVHPMDPLQVFKAEDERT